MALNLPNHRIAVLGCAFAMATAATAGTNTPYHFTTLAGVSAHGHTDGPGTQARFDTPVGIVCDSDGNAYVADAGNHLIRRITATGIVTTVAGHPGVAGRADGQGAAATFDRPVALALDSAGVLYVLDAAGFEAPTADAVLRRITPQGVVSTISMPDVLNAADGFLVPRLALAVAAGRITRATADAFASSPLLPAYDTSPFTIDSEGAIYKILGGSLYKFAPNGAVTTIAAPTDGHFADAAILTVDSAGNIIAAFDDYLERVSPAGETSELIGGGDTATLDGDSVSACFQRISELASDGAGGVLVADSTTVRRVSPSGAVNTVAGLSSTEATSIRDGKGTAARLGSFAHLTLAPDGSLFLYSSSSCGTLGSKTGKFVRRVSRNGEVTTAFAAPALSQFACDSQGTLFGIDIDRLTNTYELVRLDENGTSQPVANSLNGGIKLGILDLACGSDGTAFFLHRTWLYRISRNGTVAELGGDNPLFGGLAQDRLGNVYAAEPTHVIKLTAEASTVLPGSENWPGSFSDPEYELFPPLAPPFTVDTHGNILFVSSWGVFRQTRTGETQPLAGSPDSEGTLEYSSCIDGAGSRASFRHISDIVYDETSDIIYVLDDTTIRKGVPAGPVTITAQPQSVSTTTGTRAQFSVTATGVPAPTYQWQRNGSPIAGATAATYSIASVSSGNAGGYTVVVTNDLGAVTSDVAQLTVSAGSASGNTSGSGSSGGGGGALGGWFAAFALALTGIRRRHGILRRT